MRREEFLDFQTRAATELKVENEKGKKKRRSRASGNVKQRKKKFLWEGESWGAWFRCLKGV